MSPIDEKETIEDAREAGLLCPQCEASNVPQHRFCAKCGAALWEACFRCGEVCPAGETYCGACGVNLADAAAEQLERVQDDFPPPPTCDPLAASPTRSPCLRRSPRTAIRAWPDTLPTPNSSFASLPPNTTAGES